jgi:hypothetical protein
MEESSRLAGGVIASIRCGNHCGFGGPLAAHHDRLLAVENDLEALLELMELAITWGELDYSNTDVVAPALWAEFCAQHSWRDAKTMMRVFELATDVAIRSQTRCGGGIGSDRWAALAGLTFF